MPKPSSSVRTESPKPIQLMPGEVKDYLCEECSHPMQLKWARMRGQFFYGCTRWPNCDNAFDADQTTGAPIPGSGRPKELRAKYARTKDGTSFWDEVLREDVFL